MNRLDKLFDNLTHDQIRFLQSKISTVDFHSDPVDKLPFELCYQIFQYFEVYQLFQAQRVSRKWYRMLSSSEIVEPLVLRPWYGNSDASLRTSKGLSPETLPIPDGLSPRAAASLQAGHIDSIRNGTAFSMAVGTWPTKVHEALSYTDIVFAGSILAWTITQRFVQRYYIQLKCLISGTSANLFPPVDEEVCQVAISDTTIVAMTLSGKCCAWDLSVGIRNVESQSPECIETRIVQWDFLAVSGSTVVIIHDLNKEVMNVMTWDIEGRQSYRFRIGINLGTSLNKRNFEMSFTSGNKSIVFFERVLDKSKHFRFTRTNLKGHFESSGCIEDPHIEGYSDHPGNISPVCRTGCVPIWSYFSNRRMLDEQQAKPYTIKIIRVVYDTEADRLEIRRDELDYSMKGLFGLEDLFWWRDVVYLGYYDSAPGELEVLDLKASVCKRANMGDSALIRKTLDGRGDKDFKGGPGSSHEPECLFIGNESFLIDVRYVP